MPNWGGLRTFGGLSFLSPLWWFKSSIFYWIFFCDSRITYSKGCRGCFSWRFFIHPSILSSIHGWHHTGKKILTEINNPSPLSAHVSLSKKGMPDPKGGAPPRFWVAFGVYLPSPVFYHGQLYVAISRVTSSANIKIFSGQGPHEYMWNVIYREVLEM